MASLRQRPDEVVSDSAPVATDTNASPTQTPAPELASSQDEATLALQKQIAELKKSEQLQRQVNDAQIAMQAAKERREAWLESKPGAKENIAALGRFHHAALDAGLVDTSPAYFSFLEEQLAALQQPAEAATRMAEEMQERAVQDRAPEPPPRSSSALYSAPVSRDPPDATGSRQSNRKITLTPAEVEMARISGVSVEVYAKEKLKLEIMKRTGEYTEQQDQRR